MTNYQLKNSSNKAIGLTLVRNTGTGGVQSIMKEDISLYPGEIRNVCKLAGAHVDFHAPVDFTFRQRKAISEKFTFVTKMVKEIRTKVTAVDLPAHFVTLKIKNVHV
jgi:hypothetical protein